jgi:hypothetical protein
MSPPVSPPVPPVPPPPPSDIVCSGFVGATTVLDVVVPSGSLCALGGTQVNGSVLAAPLSTLHVFTGTHVQGNVSAREGASASILSARIDGSFTCDRCVLRQLAFTQVGRNVELDRARDGTLILASVVGGHLSMAESTGTGQFSVFSSTIDGNLTFEKNAGFVFASSNTVGGNVQLLKSGRAELHHNRVGRNMEVYKNRSSFPLVIAGNTIGGRLQCADNEPPPIGSFNSAPEKEGQCMGL